MPLHNLNWEPTHLKHLFPTPIDPHRSQKIPYNLHLGTHKNPTFVFKNIKPL
jgi:hypothetical protein